MFNRSARFDLSCLHQPRLLCRDPLQQFRGRLVIRVLFDQPAAHGEVEDEAAQAGHGVGRVGHPVVEGEQAFGVHASGGPSSASSACTTRRSSGKSFVA